ncbi:transposase [Lentibacillus amyloliquefaciens]
MKTIQNWETEVLNYHRLRFTNAVIEGHHNKKSFTTSLLLHAESGSI